MRKMLLGLILGLSTISLFAQIPVSTSPENKNVVLEEFTGIHCGYCPQGHAIAKSIQDAHPTDVVIINVHTGSYATPGAGEPDFRTAFGTAIAGQSSLTGYPAGTVNRHVFSGLGQTSGGTAMSRGNWTSASNTILAASSYVNVGVEATINVITRVLNVHVQAYYTSSSPVATNKLNVAILENNILGPQSGGNMGNEYNHMHALRHLITGQWGEVLDTTTSGKMINRWYTYTLPASYVNVPVDLANLEIAAFISETQQEIISGSRCFPVITGLTNTADAAITASTLPASLCITQVAPKIKIRNMAVNPLTSASISYSVNGGTASTYNWTGSLQSYQSAIVTLPAITYTPQATNNVSFEILTVNGVADQNPSDNTNTGSFTKAPAGLNSTFTIQIQPDNYGSETTWKIKNSSGSTLFQGGPYTDGNTTLVTQSFTLSALGCYTLEVNDSYGDGIFSPGFYKLLNSDNSVLINGTGFSTASESKPFEVTTLSSVSENDDNSIEVFPNPATEVVNILNAQNSNIMLYDVFGKLIVSDNVAVNNYSLNVADLAKGTYILKIINGDNISSRKIAVIK
ncbi:MAG TPA: Omp28-related outer membrane protein [Bacteroidales bacterium]|nr:Omp28-related outer membrane protein [Bacteroidales bacterium]